MESVDAADTLIKVPSGMVVGGPSGSGKSNDVFSLMEHNKKLIYPPPAELLYCYGIYHSDVPRLEPMGVTVCAGVPSDELLARLARPAMVVLDDLQGDVGEPWLSEMFSRRIHHENLFVVLVTQDLFAPSLRVARPNAQVAALADNQVLTSPHFQYIILTRSPNSLDKIRSLGKQLFPAGAIRFFMDAYAQATEKKFGYLMLDMHATTDPKLILQTGIFPGEERIVYRPIKALSAPSNRR